MRPTKIADFLIRTTTDVANGAIVPEALVALGRSFDWQVLNAQVSRLQQARDQ